MQYFIKENELNTFNYGGVSSASFFLYLNNINGIYDSFERDIEFKEIKGRDGDLVIDNQRRKSKTLSLECFIDLEKATKDLDTLSEEIENWIQDTMEYKTLSFSNSKKTFSAICSNQIKISEALKNLAIVQIRFKVQPN
ncbi:TPA: phage tail domain-containing protein [Clostridium perfringens]|nr:tail component protein [Clostridium phage phiCp-D]